MREECCDSMWREIADIFGSQGASGDKMKICGVLGAHAGSMEWRLARMWERKSTVFSCKISACRPLSSARMGVWGYCEASMEQEKWQVMRLFGTYSCYIVSGAQSAL